MSAVRFDHVSKAFGARTVLDDVSFEIPTGQAFCLLGRSGTGKSVTLRHIAGLVQPDHGAVFVQERDVATLARRALAEVRTHMGYLFQSAALFDSMSVGENVAFPMRRHTDWSDAEIRERATRRLVDVGLGDDYDTMPGDLSGGMKKRAGLARAMALDPAILLVDEPSAGLDPITAGEIDDLLVKTKEGGTTLVVVTHNIPSARSVGDAFAILHEGRMLAYGTIETLDDSDEPLVRAFMRSSGGRAVTPARVAGVGVFVTGGLLLFTVGLFMIGDRQMAFAKTFTVYTEFKKITGLQPGAIVRVSGAKAGSVKEILPPNTPGAKFRVRLDIAESLHQLVRTDSLATIETEGLVGGSYLGIGTGSDAAPRVGPDATIAGKEPFEITDLMRQMGETVQRVNTAIDNVQADAERAVTGIADTVGHVNALLTDVSPDVKAMVKSGANVVSDVARMTEGVRNGTGTLGKLVNDDELYTHIAAVAKRSDEIASSARDVIETAKRTLEGFQSPDGPIQGVTADVKQTMDDARAAMAGFSENMGALKRNFLVRGFFKGRGYYDLAQMSPADYRAGALTKGDRHLVRVWLRSDVLFEKETDRSGDERLSASGRARVAAAFALYLDRAPSGIVMVEGYAQQGLRDEQYRRSRARASSVRDYLLGTFHLDPQATGAMPLGADSAESPERAPWDGVALAVVLPNTSRTARK